MDSFGNLRSFQLQFIVTVLIGMLIRVVIGGRRFNSRGAAGLLHYNSYLKGLLTTFLEKLFMLCALILIVSGSILFLITR